MLQAALHQLARGAIYHCDLLKPRVKIASYNQHRRSAPFLRAFVESLIAKSTRPKGADDVIQSERRLPRPYPIFLRILVWMNAHQAGSLCSVSPRVGLQSVCSSGGVDFESTWLVLLPSRGKAACPASRRPLQRVRCFVSALVVGAGRTSYRAIIPASIWSSRWQ